MTDSMTATQIGTDILHAEAPALETPAEIAARLAASPPLLVAEHLDVTYVTEAGEVPACRDVNITLHRGEILGVAGESASGKSTLLNALSRLQRPPAITSGGTITFHPVDGGAPMEISSMSEEELRQHRWTSLSIVMQSAMASLNPVKSWRCSSPTSSRNTSPTSPTRRPRPVPAGCWRWWASRPTA